MELNSFNTSTLPNTVYHATTSDHIESLNGGINIQTGNQLTDFGPGFYLTTSHEQAKEWARTKEKIFNKRQLWLQRTNRVVIPRFVSGVVVEYELDTLRLINLNTVQFFIDDDCAEFIYHNRSKDETCVISTEEDKMHGYEAVYGPVADSRIMGLVEGLKDGSINKEEFKKSLWVNTHFNENYDQLSLHSENALNCLEWRKVELERDYRKQTVRSN